MQQHKPQRKIKEATSSSAPLTPSSAGSTSTVQPSLHRVEPRPNFLKAGQRHADHLAHLPTQQPHLLAAAPIPAARRAFQHLDAVRQIQVACGAPHAKTNKVYFLHAYTSRTTIRAMSRNQRCPSSLTGQSRYRSCACDSLYCC